MRIESEHPELVGFGGRGCFCGGGTFLPNASLCNYFSGTGALELFSHVCRGGFASLLGGGRGRDGLRPACLLLATCVHGKRVTVGRFSLDIT